MGHYISSNANRFYAALETAYGQARTPKAGNRFSAVRLQAEQVLEAGKRLDKTGTRTFLGTSKSARRHTAFEVKSYLTSWNGSEQPSYGPLFQGALGASAQLSSGLTVASAVSQTQLQTKVPHGLTIGTAIAFGNEIRFITGTPNPITMVVNAPFTAVIQADAQLTTAVTYKLSTELPSVTLYDYWDPITAVSRLVCGAAVDNCSISVNGDFHEFTFSGPAADLIDSVTFAPGSGGLSNFPAEPALSTFDYSIVPGHLGQVWLGSTASQFFTLTAASFEIKNNIVLRRSEFGSSYPRSIMPGPREVISHFTLLAQDDAQTTALYAAAKQRNPVAAMLQLGQQQGQLMGIMLPNVMPELPNYNDSQPRLQWDFKNNRAQGVSDDEIYIAFA